MQDFFLIFLRCQNKSQCVTGVEMTQLRGLGECDNCVTGCQGVVENQTCFSTLFSYGSWCTLLKMTRALLVQFG